MHLIARVLVAGRDEPNLNALHQLLESAGHAVSRTACAEDAARRVSAGEADVVLLADDALASLDRLIEAQRSNAPMSFVALSSTLSGSEARARCALESPTSLIQPAPNRCCSLRSSGPRARGNSGVSWRSFAPV